MSGRVKTRLLLLSDTHAHAPKPADQISYPCRWPLPEADIAIHTGDLTMTGRFSEHQQAIDLLKRLRAELKIVVPGNHDLTLDPRYYADHGERFGPRPKYDDAQLEQTRGLYTGSEAQAANIVYLEEGVRTLRLKNGVTFTIYASAYTPEFCGWAFAYPHSEDRFNSPGADHRVPSYERGSSAANDNIDLMLTHGPPSTVLDRVMDGSSVGCAHLYRAVSRARPLLHCFGHIHEGWGAVRRKWPADQIPQLHRGSEEALTADNPGTVTEDMGAYVDATDLQRGDETLFVNSSIMTANYSPRQSPWVVDLILGRAD